MNTINLLQSALNASSLRQQVISNNLANAETPGYKTKKVAFESILKQKLADQSTFVGKRTDSRHFFIGDSSDLPTAQVLEDSDSIMQNNENNVDVDKEMTNMGKNALWYNSLTQQLNNQFQEFSIAINGRRR